MKNKLFSAKRRVVAFLLATFLITSFFPMKSDAKAPISVNAKAAVLYLPVADTLLYSKNADARLPMASTTKIMTALVAIERENIDRKVRIDHRAVGVEGSSAYLRAGEEFSLRELLYALMLRSANDAAAAIAYAVAGDIDLFAVMMNEKVAELGLQNTNFKNPHGLDDDEHYTTALDLAKITAEALKYPEFREIASSTSKRVVKEDITRLFVNHNKMLSRYEGCIGVKTGYTQRSGRCLVSAAERDGVELIAVTLSCPDDWLEHEKMLDFGFDTLERVTLLRKDEPLGSIGVTDGTANSVKVGLESDIAVTRKTGDASPEIKIDIPDTIAAPVTYGDAVGKVRLIYPDGQVKEFDVIALENVKAVKKKRLFDLFK